MSRSSLIKNLPPFLGMLVMIVGAILLRRFFLVAVVAGLATWWLSHVALTRLFYSRETRRRHRLSALPASDLRTELDAAMGYVETLSALNQKIPHAGITAALDRLADGARFLIDEAVRQPKQAKLAPKPLQLYLKDAVDLAQRFADLQRFSDMSEQEIKKTKVSLEALVKLFAAYAQRLRKDEALDLDIRISVLKDRLRNEGIFTPEEE